MESGLNSGANQEGDRRPGSPPPRPKRRRVLARISYSFAQLPPAVGVLVLLAVSLVLSETLALSANALLFGDEKLRAALVTAIVSPMVSLPLVVFSIDTIKRLDHSKKEYRRMRDRAQAESRAKSEFLANMSHEFRTPLNAILGFTEMMQSETFGRIQPGRYREYVDDIHESGAHLLDVINDLLELSKIAAGSFRLHETVLKPAECIDLALRLVHPRKHNNNLTLEAHVGGGEDLLYADARLVKQMLLNLLSNAIKFTDEGAIYVRLAKDDSGGLVISVSDTGIGISPEDLPKVLEPFGQVEGVESRQHGGTGLGLPLVRSMMELHGGTCDLRSELGQGTTASLRFPPERLISAQRPFATQSQDT